MRVISEGNEVHSKFWRQPALQNESYRLMRYHIRSDSEQGILLLNTVTGELVLLNEEEKEILKKLPTSYKPEMKELIEHRFLVPVAFDELKSVNQLRSILQKFFTKKEITGFTILPTTSCNARCFYCYESNIPRYTMTPEIADKAAKYIVDHCGEAKRVGIRWFGGEPTVASDRIDQICERLTCEGIDFSSSMVSNGYLFSKDLARKAKEKWRLQSIQITLDGTEAVYNKVKAFANAQDSPYQRVMGNIGYLLDEGIRVSVRMNLDFHNAADLKALIDELAGRFHHRNGFSASVSELFENQGFKPVMHDLSERTEIARIKASLNRYIKEKGCNLAKPSTESDGLPMLKTFQCMADNPSALLINPLGQFGKCEHVIYSRLVGDLDQGHDFRSAVSLQWHNPVYSESCKPCALYPNCGCMDICEVRTICLPEQYRESYYSFQQQMLCRLNALMQTERT